ncbi:MAG: efflux RND transporter periplasmic adaptor subunit [Methylococcales bacterium]|nr:efflux RND transporter periplasmic adaptor subunit [Methylococcales bacterium]MDD5753220.1 efflux RND transporter periplasmic adaptor subunit [Methylococcales bacterium]
MKKYLTIFVALLITIAAIGLSNYWLTHKPRANRTPKIVAAPLVEILKPAVKNHQTTIYTMGNVIASQSVNLTPRISGLVISVSPNFVEGGLLKKGEPLVELDPTDYLLAIKQSENEVAKAQYNLKLEQGQQTIVQREAQLLGSELHGQSEELVLRKPHLQLVQAALVSAQAALKQAQLNLERTKPTVPFNAIITARNANVGAWMPAFSTGTPLAKLVGTDSFWVNVSVPVEKLRWLAIPEINGTQGAAAKITYDSAWGRGVYRQGNIKRLQAEIEPEGRMAKILVEVDDPLCQKIENKSKPPLMLGTYLQVALNGAVLHDVIELPETTLHDGKTLWLLNQKNELAFADVEPLWTENGKIYIAKDALPNNVMVITSDLAAPMVGMTLQAKN